MFVIDKITWWFNYYHAKTPAHTAHGTLSWVAIHGDTSALITLPNLPIDKLTPNAMANSLLTNKENNTFETCQ